MSTLMKALMYHQYGSPDVLHIGEIEKPTAADHEVLVRVHAVSVSFGDLMARKFGTISPGQFGMPLAFWLLSRLTFGWNKPKNPILGSEFSGVIEAVGQGVTRFKVGDPVFGYRGQQMGANTEYLVMPENGMIVHKPANVTFEEAASIPYGALTALNLLRKVKIERGQKVLINGASGGIGSFAVQLAKSWGAEVTGVCSTPRMALVKALGADRVIDYTREDFTASGERYDLVFDVLNKTPFSRTRRVLKPNGRLLLASFKMKQVLQMLWTSKRGGQRVICALSGETPNDLEIIREMIEAGTLKAVVDRSFPLTQAAEAHRYNEAGSRKGSVVLLIRPEAVPLRSELPDNNERVALQPV